MTPPQSLVAVTEAPASLPATLRAGVEAVFAFAQQKRGSATRGWWTLLTHPTPGKVIHRQQTYPVDSTDAIRGLC
jgi:hypothetical protein